MGGLSIWHILIVGLLFVMLFGKGKISDLMGDVAKGIKSFKKGMADDEDEGKPTSASTAEIDHKTDADLAKPSESKNKATKS
jgi:sec-independent protein translocase protein TatA